MADAEPLPFAVQPEEAIAAFKAKGWAFAFSWQDVWQEENVRAFTVAKAMCRDLLEDIRAEVDRAISEGRTLAQFAADLRPKLEARGWWGRKWMVDPATGEQRVVQLGSPARLRTIYRTNMRTSMMAGRWQRLQRTKRAFPFLRYVAILDGRERPEHGAWHDTILPVDHPWWDTHFPPCGWNCRCDAQPLNQRMIDRRGWTAGEEPARFPVRDHVNKRTGEVVRLEQGIDPGWSYNVGKATLDGLTPSPRISGPMGEDSALNAVLSGDDYAPLKGFFAAFGLADRQAALAGTVWTDPAGWPVPISAGLLRDAGGRIVRLSADRAAALVAAAQVMRAPDTISWIWVTGKDGRAMLVRRYRSAAGVVDIGARFWRWHAGNPGRFQAGQPVWNAENSELSAFDPRQPRHPKGSRDGGKFRRTGRMEVRSALGQATSGADVGEFKTATLCAVDGQTAERAAKHGVNIAGREVRLDRSTAIHVLNRHGAVAVKRSGSRERAMTGEDLLNAHSALAQAISFRHSGTGRDGMPRIEVDGPPRRGRQLRLVFEVSSKRLNLVTMFDTRAKRNEPGT